MHKANNSHGASGMGKSQGSGFGMLGSSGHAMPTPDAAAELLGRAGVKGSCVIYIDSDSVGSTGEAHARKLMHHFLYTLTEIAPQPKAIILVNSAVKLAKPGSSTLESLSLMQEQGVQILIADKSITAMGCEGNIAVGKPATLHNILNTMLQAEKVISL